MASLVDTTINGSLTVKGSQTDNLNGFKFTDSDGKDGNNWCITPLSKSKLDLGSPTFPFRNIYADSFQLTVPPQTTEEDDKDISVNSMQMSDDSTNKISTFILGNEIADKNGNVNNPSSRKGRLLLFGANQAGTYLQTAQKGTTDGTFNIITLPDKTGTVSLEGHSHAFKTNNCYFMVANRDGNFTKALNKNYHETNEGYLFGVKKASDGSYVVDKDKIYGKITLKNSYCWGSDFLDIFTIRGYATFTLPKMDPIKPNTRLRLGCLKSKKSNYLPEMLVPLSIYRNSKYPTIGMLTKAVTSNEDDFVEASFIDIRCAAELGSRDKEKTYTIYFGAAYGNIGDSYTEEEMDAKDQDKDIDQD